MTENQDMVLIATSPGEYMAPRPMKKNMFPKHTHIHQNLSFSLRDILWSYLDIWMELLKCIPMEWNLRYRKTCKMSSEMFS